MELIASPGTAIHTCQYECKAITEDTCGKNVNVNGLYFYKNWLQVKLVIVALLDFISSITFLVQCDSRGEIVISVTTDLQTSSQFDPNGGHNIT